MLPDIAAGASSVGSNASDAGRSCDANGANAPDASPDSGGDVADQTTVQLGRLLSALADPVAAKGLSLARISKRCALPMSTLRRLLTGLEDAGLVGVTLTEDGRGAAVLTQAGSTLAASLTVESAASPEMPGTSVKPMR